MSLKYWLKKHWWWFILPVIIPFGLYILWYFNQRAKIKNQIEKLSEDWHNSHKI